jgi:hypothetical protein
MKIVSKIGRVDGEVVDMVTRTYAFQRDAAGRPYLEVDDPDHIGTLLAIREGFALHPDETGAPPAPTVATIASPMQMIPEPVTEIVGDDDDDGDRDDGGETDPDADLDAMTIEQLRAEYRTTVGNEPSDKAPAHILRKTLAKHRAAA